MIPLPENRAVFHPRRLLRKSYGTGRHLDPNEVIAEVDCDGIMRVSQVLCRQSSEKASKRTGPVELDEYPPTLYADHVRVHDCVPTLGRLQSRHREAVEAL